MNGPLRLAVGSHAAGSGKGCEMNVISWENGDTQITDFPSCSDRLLSRIVQNVNDMICAHRDGDLLCAECSMKVLELAHRTMGTGDLEITEDRRRRIWVAIAADQARSVLHLCQDKVKAEGRITSAEVYAQGGAKPAAAVFALAGSWAGADCAAAVFAFAASTGTCLERAHHCIDLFQSLTQHVAPAPDPAHGARAIELMTTPSVSLAR